MIPTRNRGRIVRRAIDSVLTSLRDDVEVVAVDDGSADDTAVKLSQIGDARFRFHRLDSTGNANRARNVGARLSTGALIAFLDSDDAFGPTRISRLIDFFSHRPDVDCLLDGYIDNTRGARHAHGMPQHGPGPEELRYMLLAHLVPLTNSAVTLRRSAFEAIGGYDEMMPRHQDREFLLRLARNHSIWFGASTDVEKHRMAHSLSHEFDGYIAGLDALAARCPEYHLPENADVFRYLIVRGIVKAIATGRWPAALREFREWSRAPHLPKDYLRCLRSYGPGRRSRQRARVKRTSANRDPLPDRAG